MNNEANMFTNLITEDMLRILYTCDDINEWKKLFMTHAENLMDLTDSGGIYMLTL